MVSDRIFSSLPMDKLTLGITDTAKFSCATVKSKKILFMALQYKVAFFYKLQT